MGRRTRRPACRPTSCSSNPNPNPNPNASPNPNPNPNPEQAYLDIGRVIGLEHNRKPVDSAKAGMSVSVKIDAVTSVAYGRQFDLTYLFHSRVTRKSIDALKEFFKEDVAKEDWQLLLRLKKMFGVL